MPGCDSGTSGSELLLWYGAMESLPCVLSGTRRLQRYRFVDRLGKAQSQVAPRRVIGMPWRHIPIIDVKRVGPRVHSDLGHSANRRILKRHVI